MNKDFGYVLKNSDGLYFIDYSQVSNQLRKAKIYHSLKYANNRIKSLDSNKLRGVKLDFKIYKITIEELVEV